MLLEQKCPTCKGTGVERRHENRKGEKITIINECPSCRGAGVLNNCLLCDGQGLILEVTPQMTIMTVCSGSGCSA